MRVAIIGSGYVGLVTGSCFCEFGFNVTSIDNDINKIERLKKGEIPIYEPGLEALVQQGLTSGRLSFTTEISEAVSNADIVMIAVGTPSRRGDGHADLTYVFEAAKQVAQHLKDYTVVVTKSTVPVGTSRKVAQIIQETRPDLTIGKDFDVASNPEFLREGSAITDFMRPDRVVIGAESENARKILQELYRPLYLRETPIVFTNIETAELIKYASNGFLAMKIAFINQIADICEQAGADVQDVAKAVGLDGRIGRKFLHAGPGYGGSCFPKDTLALAQTARQLGTPMSLIEAVVEANDQRKLSMAERIIKAVKGKKIAILGITFKPNTDDLRDAPSLVIIPELQKAGFSINVYDPLYNANQGQAEAKPYFSNIEWSENPYHAAENADAVIILTEWNECRALDLKRLNQQMNKTKENLPHLIDFRNIYNEADVTPHGFQYSSIGRPSLKSVA